MNVKLGSKHFILRTVNWAQVCVKLTYQVKSNILIMRVNCERSVKCTRQTWDHSSQAARRRLKGFMKTNQTDKLPENSCPLTSLFALLSRQVRDKARERRY